MSIKKYPNMHVLNELWYEQDLLYTLNSYLCFHGSVKIGRAFGTMKIFAILHHLICLFTINFRNYFPSTIAYETLTADVDKWPKTLKEDGIPIPWVDESKIIEKKVGMI